MIIFECILSSSKDLNKGNVFPITELDVDDEYNKIYLLSKIIDISTHIKGIIKDVFFCLLMILLLEI